MENGVLDLQSHNFNQNKSLEISGDFEFYWNEFIHQKDISHHKLNSISASHRWNDSLSSNNKIGSNGYATYRLTILNNKFNDLAINTNGIHSSYAIYINGELVDQSGRVGKSKEESDFKIKPVLLKIPSGEKVEILFHVSNFFHLDGGLKNPFFIGKTKTLKEEKLNRILLDFFLFGALFIMSILHFIIYLLRRSDKSAIYFAFLCLFFSVRPFFRGERILAAVFPYIDENILHKLDYILLFTAFFYILSFLKELFPNEFKTKAFNVYSYILLVFNLIFLLTPIQFSYSTLSAFYILTITALLHGLVSISKAIIYKREGAVSFCVGILALSIFSINDILYTKGILNTGHFIYFGVLVFIFSQAYLLSSKFSKAFKQSEISRAIAIEQRNLAEKRRIEIELLTNTKDQFLSNLSEELKKPLENIYSDSEILITQTDQINPTKLGKSIFTNAKILNRYVEDLILTTDLESNIKLNLEYCSVKEILDAEIKNLIELAEPKKIKIENHVSYALKINADRKLLEKLFYEILKNSIQYNTDFGSVYIKEEIRADYIIISIQDTGIGISQDHQKKIFDKFFRINSFISYDVIGAGLGLYIANKIASLHNGKLEVSSILEEGALFKAYFPRGNNK